MLALDGAIAGTPHRDIAIALFSLPKVEEQWHGSANSLRDYVRRAIAYGRELCNGGYVRFIKIGTVARSAFVDCPLWKRFVA
jgi:hypothetical protein